MTYFFDRAAWLGQPETCGRLGRRVSACTSDPTRMRAFRLKQHKPTVNKEKTQSCLPVRFPRLGVFAELVEDFRFDQPVLQVPTGIAVGVVDCSVQATHPLTADIQLAIVRRSIPTPDFSDPSTFSAAQSRVRAVAARVPWRHRSGFRALPGWLGGRGAALP